MKKLKVQPFAISLAVWSATVMLALGILGNMGLYENGVKAMMQWHLFFNLSVTGIITGMIEGAVVSYFGVLLFGFIYNSINRKN